MSVSHDLVAAKRRLFGSELTPHDAGNASRFGAWAMAWAVTYVVAIVAFELGVHPGSPAAWLLAIGPTVIGGLTTGAYLRFVRAADELQRRIQLEALAIGFGAGVLFMMGYRLLERNGWPKLDVNDGLLVMLLAWAAGQVRAARRYS